MLIAVVGLLVIGPDKLPATIKSLAMGMSKTKRMIRHARAEIEQHIGADDIRREIHNEEVLASLRALKKSEEALKDFAEDSIESLNNNQGATPNLEKQQQAKGNIKNEP